jgi:hypothetical protein
VQQEDYKMLPDFITGDAKEEKPAPTDEELSTIAGLAFQQLQWQNTLIRLENETKVATEGLKKIQEQELPAAMAAAGLSKFTLLDGSSIEVKADVFPSIPEAKESLAFKWLNDNGFGAVIKDEVKCQFGKGETAKAKAMLAFAKEHGYPASEKMSVHAGTLKALVKEQRALGVVFPEECFSIFDVTKSVINNFTQKSTRKKKKK